MTIVLSFSNKERNLSLAADYDVGSVRAKDRKN
jgi:hypothetical protein